MGRELGAGWGRKASQEESPLKNAVPSIGLPKVKDKNEGLDVHVSPSPEPSGRKRIADIEEMLAVC